MAAFTTITTGTDWQSAAVMQELQQGLIERVLAIGGYTDWKPSTVYVEHDIVKNITSRLVYRCTVPHTSSVSFDASKFEVWTTMLGKDLQGRIFSGETNGNVDWYGWQFMQSTLENICTSYVDHSISLTTLATPTKYTVASWRSAAGINAAGFKRSAVVPWAAGYGNMQEGDVIGNWIFAEIQAGLSALQWTSSQKAVGTDTLDNGATRAASGFDVGSCATARSNYDTAWSGASYVGAVTPYYRASYNTTYVPATPIWSFAGTRNRGQPKIIDIEDVAFAHTAECWLLASSSGFGIDAYADIDGVANGDNKLFKIEDFGSAVTTSRTAALYGSSVVDPNPDTCPIGAQGATHGFACTTAEWILKWVFTNS